ncbi:MAG: transcriptional regulator, partial [Acidimicrobiaceae bacterium]|nr:transcriptional regulator [Acidimicrobiaceae bacterium]
MSDNELGAFIRARREALRPEAVGLPAGTRRRTPGLRRAELAVLAGLSVDYLVRIEQGRDRRPSGQVLMALADALRLDESERQHLKRLGAMTAAPEFCGERPPAATEIRATVRTLLDRLEPAPALVLNHLSDILAWTTTYDRLARPLGILDHDPPSLLRYTFGDPRAATTYPEWSRVADEQVANLRALVWSTSGEADLIDELGELGGDEFARRWRAHPVEAKGVGSKRIVHPDVGELHLRFETMALADGDGQRLVVYLPGDEVTAQRLDQLA